MQRGAESVEVFPSEEDVRDTVHAAIALAHQMARLLEELHAPAHVAVLGACWLLADCAITAELRRGIPATVTRAAIDRQIDTAIGELRAALVTDPATIQ